MFNLIRNCQTIKMDQSDFSFFCLCKCLCFLVFPPWISSLATLCSPLGQSQPLPWIVLTMDEPYSIAPTLIFLLVYPPTFRIPISTFLQPWPVCPNELANTMTITAVFSSVADLSHENQSSKPKIQEMFWASLFHNSHSLSSINFHCLNRSWYSPFLFIFPPLLPQLRTLPILPH